MVKYVMVEIIVSFTQLKYSYVVPINMDRLILNSKGTNNRYRIYSLHTGNMTLSKEVTIMDKEIS